MDTKNLKSAELASKLKAATDPEVIKAIAEEAIHFVADQETVIAGHVQTIAEATNANLELQNQLDQLKLGVVLKPEVKVNKQTYTVEHSVNLDGVVYSPEAIAGNADVAKQLVKSESTALVLKVTE